MLLAIDAGNTNVTLGVFDGAALTHRWRLRTVREQTADEWGVLMRNLFSLDGVEPPAIHGIIVSSVVPSLDASLRSMAKRYFNTDPLFVSHDLDTGIAIRYDNPREVGADRIVNAVAAWHRFQSACIVVDLGTAITFDAISNAGEYLGGVISPGIAMSISGLFSWTARLPMVDFCEPAQVIGTNTVASMQSGLYFGFAAVIDGIVERMTAELGPGTRTIATGGHAHLIVKALRLVHESDEDLTLQGLRLIWERQGRNVPAKAK